MFESPDLGNIAFLVAKGFKASPTTRRGRFLFFTVDLSEQEAETLLASPEGLLVSQAFDAFRRLRRACFGWEELEGGRR